MFRLRQDRMTSEWRMPLPYENLPHARSVVHQISLSPPMMTTPNATHS